jgi:hypothetical protein
MPEDWISVEAVSALVRGPRGLDRHGDPTASPEDRQTVAVELVTALVKGYTRGGGFDADGVPVHDLRAVIVAAALRFLANPGGLQAEGVRHFGEIDNTGLTLLERLVCNRYRVMAR